MPGHFRKFKKILERFGRVLNHKLRTSKAALPLAGCAVHNRRFGRLSEGRTTS